MNRLFCIVLFLGIFGVFVKASSHSEAPGTAAAPFQDLADWYAFRSYETGKENNLILMATAYGGQKPGLGPNYFTLSDSHMFEMHVSCNNDGTSDSTHIFQFYFGATMGGKSGTQLNSFDETDCLVYGNLPNFKGPITGAQGITLPVGPDKNGVTRDMAVPLKVMEPLSANLPAGAKNLQNWFEHYFVQYKDGKTGATTLLTGPDSNNDGSFDKPFDFVGEKTFGSSADYETYAQQYVHTVDNIPTCNGQNARVFVGARADPFGIDLGRTFDLLNYIPIPGFPNAVKDCPENNYQSNSNVAALVLEVPIACLPCNLANGDAHIVGTWARVGTLLHDSNGNHVFGQQTNRLGMPLVNEVVIGLKDKKFFNTDVPNNDAGQFLDYVQYPTFPEIINIYFKDAVNSVLNKSFKTIAPTNFPRADLVGIFLTGLPGLNQPKNVGASEMLRINLDVPPVPQSKQNHYGVLAGYPDDIAGFPNGRRPGDDALDIVVQVAMGAVCASDIPIIAGVFCNSSDAVVGGVQFLDGAPVNAMQFSDTFPFLNTPHSGGILTNPHPSECNSDLPCNGCTPCNSPAAIPVVGLLIFALLALFAWI